MKKSASPSARRRRIVGCLVVVVLFVGGVVAAGVRVARMMAQAAHKPLEFATVKRGTVSRKVSETGTIAPWLQVEVKSKVAGRITRLFVDEGDRVRAGQLVALVDPTEVQRQANQVAADVKAMRARLAQAEWGLRQQRENTATSIKQAAARLASAEANLRRLESGSRPEEIARAKAQVARATAEAQEAREALERALALQKAGATAREDALAALDAARADMERIEAGSRPEEIARAQAAVNEAQASVEEADRNLKRKRDLYRQGFVSRQDMESAEAAAARAHAALESARQQLLLVNAGPRSEERKAAAARLRQAEIAARSACSNADQTVAAAKARAASAEAALHSARQELALVQAGPRREEIEAARAQVAEARAALQAARAGTARDAVAEAEVQAMRAELQRAYERLEAARVQLADTKLVAPISGTIITRHIRAGELVASGVSGLSAGVPVVTIADLSALIARVRLNEVDVAQVRVGQPVEVSLDAYPGVVFPGRVRRIAPAALGRGGPGGESQIVRFDVEVALTRPDPRLRTGMTASVDILLDRHTNVLYVVREALVRDDKGWTALVVRNPGKVRRLKWPERSKLEEKDVPTRKVRVKAGLRDDTRIEVCSGLREKDLLLIDKSGRVQRRRFEIREGE